MNITKKKQTHRYGEQTSGYQYREGRGEGQSTMYKINKLQGYIVQHREYSQYIIITINGL